MDENYAVPVCETKISLFYCFNLWMIFRLNYTKDILLLGRNEALLRSWDLDYAKSYTYPWKLNLLTVNTWKSNIDFTNLINDSQYRTSTEVSLMVRVPVMWYKLKDKFQLMQKNVIQKFSKRTESLVTSYQYYTTEPTNLYVWDKNTMEKFL